MPEMVTASDLIHRVTIQEETRIPDGQGGYDGAWADITVKPRAWAKVTGLTGGEALSNLVERSTAQWRVIIRQRTGITTKNRLVWNGKELDIKSVLPHPANPRAFLLLICESEAI